MIMIEQIKQEKFVQLIYNGIYKLMQREIKKISYSVLKLFKHYEFYEN